MASMLLQVRIDNDLKKQAAELYESLGIDLSTAIRMFLKRSIMVNGVPFSMTLPHTNKESSIGMNALQQLSMYAAQNGLSEMTLYEINAEITATRHIELK